MTVDVVLLIAAVLFVALGAAWTLLALIKIAVVVLYRTFR